MALVTHENFDVIIEAGKLPNIREFHAHSVILSARSPFFQAELAVKNSLEFTIKTPFISPNVLNILLG